MRTNEFVRTPRLGIDETYVEQEQDCFGYLNVRSKPSTKAVVISIVIIFIMVGLGIWVLWNECQS